MTDNLIEKIVSEISTWPIPPAITLHGLGEPLLDKSLEKRIRSFRKAGASLITFSTNASLMTLKRAKKIIEAMPDIVVFPIESLNKEIYENIRKGLVFETTLLNINDFIEMRNELKSNIIIRMAFIHKEHTEATINELASYFRKRLKLNHDEIITTPRHNFAQSFSDFPPGESFCSMPFDYMPILADGTVSLCCVDSEAQSPMGNIIDNSILDIFNNNEFGRVRAKMNNGERSSIKLCASCNLPDTQSFTKIVKVTADENINNINAQETVKQKSGTKVLSKLSALLGLGRQDVSS